MAGVAASNHVQDGERRTINTKPNVVVPGSYWSAQGLVSDGTKVLGTSLFANRSLPSLASQSCSACRTQRTKVMIEVAVDCDTGFQFEAEC